MGVGFELGEGGCDAGGGEVGTVEVSVVCYEGGVDFGDLDGPDRFVEGGEVGWWDVGGILLDAGTAASYGCI